MRRTLMAASLRVLVETEAGEDAEEIPATEVSQLRHQATAGSSIVASMVGFAAKPNSSRFSPSKCNEMAS